jgi:tetratricopeptide (TPR) repeat protein
MKRKIDFLPRRLKKEEIALAPMAWIGCLTDYLSYRYKARRENNPGYNTLVAGLSAAIVKRNKQLIDFVANLTKENVPRHIYLALTGSALCDLGLKDKGYAMLREAVESDSTHSIILVLAANTDDLDEKESLAKRVLAENPNDGDALRALAYAKYFKGEHEEAERAIDRILFNESDNTFALEFKGNVYFDKKEYQKALEQYLQIKKRVKLIPVSLQFKICHCYYLIGNLRKAKKMAKNIKDKIALAYDMECSIEHANELLTEVLSS